MLKILSLGFLSLFIIISCENKQKIEEKNIYWKLKNGNVTLSEAVKNVLNYAC